MGNIFSKKEVRNLERKTGAKKGSLSDLEGKVRTGREARGVIKSSDVRGSVRRSIKDEMQNIRNPKSVNNVQGSDRLNKPKTKWWQSLSKPSNVRESDSGTQSNKSRFGIGLGSSNESRDELREQFAGSRKGIGFTSKRGQSKVDKSPRKSIMGKRFGS